MLRIATINVNGVRAAFRKGMADWLRQRRPDVVTLQEVRAPAEVVTDLFGGEQVGEGWHLAHTAADRPGRAGVAIASRFPLDDVSIGNGDPTFDESGRWVEAQLGLPDGSSARIASVYVHACDADSPRQQRKYRFMDAMLERMRKMEANADHALVTGDLNVGHTERDIKNWKGNRGKSGFLIEERAYFDRIRDEFGWVDLGRWYAGEVDGPYTWWSYRGRAFDNDAGWRIDYQLATRELADSAVTVAVDRADSYATRWSDHAPLVVDYDV